MSTLDGDGPCQDCGGPNIVWFTENVLWNEVMRQGEFVPGQAEAGILCIPCFVKRTERTLSPTGWRLLPEWPWRASAPTSEAK